MNGNIDLSDIILPLGLKLSYWAIRFTRHLYIPHSFKNYQNESVRCIMANVNFNPHHWKLTTLFYIFLCNYYSIIICIILSNIMYFNTFYKLYLNTNWNYSVILKINKVVLILILNLLQLFFVLIILISV